MMELAAGQNKPNIMTTLGRVFLLLNYIAVRSPFLFAKTQPIYGENYAKLSNLFGAGVSKRQIRLANPAVT
jgi:hypothetical protein